MSFSGPLVAEFLDDGARMRVLNEIRYRDGAGRLWIVPAGFVTDGASIPKALWSLVGSPFTGLYRVAAVLHDAAYQNDGVKKDDADHMLREAALELGCSRAVVDLIYEGVRMPPAAVAFGDDQLGATLDAALGLDGKTC